MRLPRVLLVFLALPLCGTATFLMPSPTRADCAKWDLNGKWVFAQNNGYNTSFWLHQDGDRLSGNASYESVSGKSNPGISKSLEGTFDKSGNLWIKVEWISGSVANYRGGMSPEGRLAGVVKDETTGNATGWRQLWHNDTDSPATCAVEATTSPSGKPVTGAGKKRPIDQKPGGMGVGDILKATKPPAQPPAQPPAGETMATVIADADVYKIPGGTGKPIGVLHSNNKTTKVSLIEPCADNWCHVKGNAVPTGEGWVYSGTPPDFQSLAF